MSHLDCDNQLVVLGSFERRAYWLRVQGGISPRFSAEPGRPTRFTLNAAVPIPTAVLNGPYLPATRDDDELADLYNTDDPHRASGFTWCLRHWGTSADINLGALQVNFTQDALTLTFPTAFDAPAVWLEHAAKPWPDVDFTLTWHSAFRGSIGRAHASHGHWSTQQTPRGRPR